MRISSLTHPLFLDVIFISESIPATSSDSSVTRTQCLSHPCTPGDDSAVCHSADGREIMEQEIGCAENSTETNHPSAIS